MPNTKINLAARERLWSLGVSNLGILVGDANSHGAAGKYG